MPALRPPWFKFWNEAITHEKVAMLSDAVFRTWVHVLAEGSQQPVRARFASAKHCAVATGRPIAHIRQLIARRLLDETEDGAVVIHDSADWQDVRPSDLTRSERRREATKGRTKVGHRSDTFHTRGEKGEVRSEKGDVRGEKTIPSPGGTSPAGGMSGGGMVSAAGAAVAPPGTTSGPGSAQGDGADDLEPLLQAFEAIGLARPMLAGRFDARDARDLLKCYAPDTIALCWQDYESGEYGDDFDRKHLSFGYLANRNRIGNWQREQVERAASEARPDLRVVGGSY